MKIRSIAMSALAVAVALAGSVALESPAVAAPTAGTADITPYACIAETTYSLFQRTVGFQQTDTESYETPGPAEITLTTSSSVDQTFSASASFTFNAGILLASAGTTFNVGYSYSTSSSTQFSYKFTVPSGKRGKVRLFHRSDRIHFDKYVTTPSCTTSTYTGGVGYFPIENTSNGTYCAFIDLAPYRDLFFAAPCSNS